MTKKKSNTPLLSWALQDFERKFFFPGSKQTNVNPFLSLIFGALGTVVFYGVMLTFRERSFAYSWLQLGWIPYVLVFIFFWSLSILFIKWRKLVFQGRALTVKIVPDEPGFVLSPRTVDQILENTYRQVQDPDKFILFNRVLRAISNLKNLGRVSDVEVIIRSQSDMDHDAMQTSYAIINGFVWAMPVLGFIGTVLGLSLAIGGFGKVLAAGGEISNLRESLKGVVGSLSLAFETTFQGLIFTLAIQTLMTFLRKKEEDFLESCDDYCHKHIVSKLRMLGHEEREP